MIKNPGFGGIQSGKHRDSDVAVADHWLAEFRTGSKKGKQQVEAASDGLKLSWGTPPRRARLWQDLDREWASRESEAVDLILLIALTSKSKRAKELFDWVALLRAEGPDWTIHAKFNLNMIEVGQRSIVTGAAPEVILTPGESYRLCVQFRSQPASILLHHIYATACDKANVRRLRKSPQPVVSALPPVKTETGNDEAPSRSAAAAQRAVPSTTNPSQAVGGGDVQRPKRLFWSAALGLRVKPSAMTARWHRDSNGAALPQRISILRCLWRQLRLKELRSHDDIATFTSATAGGGLEPLIATLLWKLLRDHAYVDDYRAGADDDLLSIYGLGPKQAWTQLIQPLMIRIGCPSDVQPPSDSEHKLATPRDIVSYVALCAGQQRNKNPNVEEVQSEPA